MRTACDCAGTKYGCGKCDACRELERIRTYVRSYGVIPDSELLGRSWSPPWMCAECGSRTRRFLLVGAGSYVSEIPLCSESCQQAWLGQLRAVGRTPAVRGSVEKPRPVSADAQDTPRGQSEA